LERAAVEEPEVRDHELYAKILGVQSPWFVARVELALKDGEIDVYLEHAPETRWPCPQCEQSCSVYDHQPARQWRHLDTCQYRTIIHASPPRIDCPEHGALVVCLPWAEANSRFSTLFEALAIDWLGAASQSAVARILRLSWDEIHAIMERAVRRGLARRCAEPIPYVGVDEKAARKGHNYLTIVNDLQRSRVLYVAQERTAASLDGFWPTLSAEQRDSIRAVCVDMWDPFVNSIRSNVPTAEVVYDKFHIAKHLGEAVDLVRRAENRALRSAGDGRLIGTKYDWLKNPASFTSSGWRDFRSLRESDLKTARAWALKESAMRLFDYHYAGVARRYFTQWYFWATHSRLKPVIKVARMLKGRFENVITYLRHRITNATSESLNARIQWVKFTARGYRNVKNFITAIYFHCGGLDLKPLPT
jgi:transposase